MTRMIFAIAIGMLTVATGATSAWVPPLGIPKPEFGIDEQASSRPAAWPGAPSVGSYYIDNTHPQASDDANPYGYPDKPRLTIPSAILLTANSLVEIHGGPYLATPAAYAWQIKSSATAPPTAEAPAFVRGFDGVVWGVSPEAIAAKVAARIECGGGQGQGLAYAIIENIHFQRIPVAIIGYTSHHSCIRNCEANGHHSSVMNVTPSEPWTHANSFTADSSGVCVSAAHGLVTGSRVRVAASAGGTLPGGLAAFTTYYAIRLDDNTLKLATTEQDAAAGIAIAIADAGSGTHRFMKFVASEVHDIVFYNNRLHDTDLWNDVTNDWDFHGISVSTWHRTSDTRLRRVWVLDNTFYHLSGDSVQVNANTAGNAALHHVYIGRNTAYENRQSGFWCKQASDVIMSQNTVHTMNVVGTGLSGNAFGFQYGPDRLWFLFNEIYDCDYGIRQSDTSGAEGRHVYIIGNYIHDSRQDTDDDHWGSPPGWGLSFWSGSMTRHVVDNTIANVHGGIELVQPGPFTARGNLIFNLKRNANPKKFGMYRNHIELASVPNNDADVEFVKCLAFGQEGGVSQQARIKWRGTQYATLSSAQSATRKLTGCIEAAPMLDGPKPLSKSPVIAAGAESDEYRKFQELYGIDIRRGFDGGMRPAGSGWDIGACEHIANTHKIPAPTGLHARPQRNPIDL